MNSKEVISEIRTLLFGAEEPKVENNNEDIIEQNIQPKPAYKPRFKPAMIRKDPEQE